MLPVKYLILGRSGSGKSSLVAGEKVVKSRATRPPKPHEQEKLNRGEPVDHIFVTPADVEKDRQNMVAYTKIGDVEYYATKKDLDDADYYIIDPVGEEELRKSCEGQYQFVSIYVSVPKDIQLQRLLKRNDDPEQLQRRLAAEDEQFSHYEAEQKYDALIQNTGTLAEAKEQLNKIREQYECIKPEREVITNAK